MTTRDRQRAGTQRLGLHLTDRCQLDCDHCLRDPGAEPLDLPLAIALRAIDDARSLYGITRVSLTGGEPTLHPDFFAIVDAMAARRMRWDMVTNGHRFDRVVERLDTPARRGSLAQIVVSIDGPDAQSHDDIRGPGSFRDAMAAVALAATEGIPFGLQATLHRRNAAHIEAIGVLAGQLGAAHVSFAMMQPTGTRLDAAFALTAAEWRALHERIGALAGILRLSVIAPEGWPDPQPMSLCGPMRGDTIHVDVRGRLSLCCLHSGIPGDGEPEVAGSAAEGLVGPHARLLEIVRDASAARLRRLRGPHDAWSEFACNACLADHGKPHWSDGGVIGPTAARPRWRGAWERGADGKHVRLLVLDGRTND